ncbi:MAG: DUF2867 domain-containing protein [Marinoscillum sp.]|uniref:DUF2867 domain-containing protein n=1 Tax=Marinoscillum sp. TaxID=2024838 RepID=UPI0032F56571
MSQKIKISPEEHLRHPLRVHDLLSDYELEDVWRFPVILQPGHSLDQFLKLFKSAGDQLSGKGLAGLLFRFRLFLGKLFHWDDQQRVDHLIPGTLRHRYAEREQLTFAQLPDPGTGDFIPVYQLENEFLSEIANKTVEAALHISRVSEGSIWVVHMAVYVKPKGAFGRFYMALIKPFRLWIVYPAMMQAAKKKWERFTNESKHDQ